jgi:uncharacterized membrane protein
MDFSNDVILKAAVFVLAVCGFFVAKHIYHKKRSEQPFVCPINFDCHAVVNSDYSRFMGIPVEILGMIYYGFLALAYLALLLLPIAWPYYAIIAFVALSLAAFIFSAYLIFIQIFAIKTYCSWCIVSAIISTIIFFVSLSAHGLL